MFFAFIKRVKFKKINIYSKLRSGSKLGVINYSPIWDHNISSQGWSNPLTPLWVLPPTIAEIILTLTDTDPTL